jgi:hypothetical protein
MTRLAFLAASAATFIMTAATAADEFCQGFGPQTPRDITQTAGTNPRLFAQAPAAGSMNLCNIHTHTNAEHKGPGFSVSAGTGAHGGFQCNDSAKLSVAERSDTAHGHGGFHGVKPGDTIEVHLGLQQLRRGAG